MNKPKYTRVNQQIRVPKIRVIGADGSQLGVLDTRQAFFMAQEQGLDLVEIVPDANPPVCKIIDFGKYKYELSKREKEGKKKQHSIQLKEIRLRPNIEKHDLETKIRQARDFLTDKHKVKFTLMFKGREMAHQEFGESIIKEIEAAISDVGKIEGRPKMEGKNLIMFVIGK